MLGLFSPEAQDEVWSASPDTLIGASLIFPAGRARPADGGCVISGRWPFASGIDSCGWTMLGGLVAPQDGGDDAAPEYRIFLLEASQYQVLDTWHAAALRGIGSNNIAAEDVFVPAHRTLAIEHTKGCAAPGLAVNPGALYRLPVFALFPYVLSGCALGTAQGALADFVAATRRRVGSYSGAKMAEHTPVQIKISEAAVRIDAAALLMRRACDEAMAFAHANEVPDLVTKLRFRRDGAHAANECKCMRAVDILLGAAGGAALYESNPLQRSFRDVHAINAHISFDFDVAGTAYGRGALGLDVDSTLL